MNTKRTNRRRGLFPSIPVAEVFSFLKDTKGLSSWTLRDLAGTLGISMASADEILPLLEMQGYIGAYRKEWVTTISGEVVSGSKFPRFTPETIEAAISSLQKRIDAANKDSKAPYRVKRAVAFGDFLNKTKMRVQAADIGILLEVRKTKRHDIPTERPFLKLLRGKTAMLNLKPYEDWMRARTHRKIV
jgi:hypothetical protein